MALTINYNVDPNVDTVYLYRAVGRKIELDDLRLEERVVLDKTKTEHVYNDGIDGKHYSFVIESVDVNGRKNYSPIQNIIYKRELGPGPGIIQRGYFDFGVFGELSTEEFGMTPEGVWDVINQEYPVLGEIGGSGETSWYKCLVDGKIIFIPSNRYVNSYVFSSMSKDSLVTRGLIDNNNTFNDCPIITINGFDYRWRGMKKWTQDKVINPNDLTDVLKSSTINYRSEIAMMACLRQNLVPGKDHETFGFSPNTTDTDAPFVGGDINSVLVNGSYSITAIGGSVYPNGGGGVYCSQTTTPKLYYNNAYFFYIPVLELLD